MCVVCVHLLAVVGTWSTLSVAPLFLGLSWISSLGVCNLFFVAIFTAEAVLKLFSFGPTIYFAEAWNKFDCTVVRSTFLREGESRVIGHDLVALSDPIRAHAQVVVSVVGLFVNAGVGANVVRVFRIARAFRLIKRAKALNALFQTLVLSLPSLWNIGSLLFVLFFIFAVLGESYFSYLSRSAALNLTHDAVFVICGRQA